MEEQNTDNQQISNDTNDKNRNKNKNRRYFRNGVIRGAIVTFLVMVLLLVNIVSVCIIKGYIHIGMNASVLRWRKSDEREACLCQCGT